MKNNDRNEFRVWDTKEKKMYNPGDCADFDFGVYPFYLSSDGVLNRVTHQRGYKGESMMGLDSSEQDRFVIQKCFGLEDYNDTLAYEGDIVTINHFIFDGGSEIEQEHTGVIKYSTLHCSFCLADIKGGFYDFSKEDIKEGIPLNEFLGTIQESYEIIGNIYENPELLEK